MFDESGWLLGLSAVFKLSGCLFGLLGALSGWLFALLGMLSG
jgi:hypothetical protein